MVAAIAPRKHLLFNPVGGFNFQWLSSGGVVVLLLLRRKLCVSISNSSEPCDPKVFPHSIFNISHINAL